MANAYICDGIRTPIGRFGGVLSGVRADDLGAIPIKALKDRYPALDWTLLDDVILGCANQAGEDNRDVARMSLLLAGMPMEVSGTTINRLCGSGMDAISYAARSIKAGEASLMIAGGVESMSRAPYVLSKPTVAFDRNGEMFDTTIGWRFINPLMQKQYGSDSMPETAENVARRFNISREDQDAFALRSQQRTQNAKEKGVLAQEITPVAIPQRKGEPLLISEDEHPRPETTLAQLSSLRAPFAKDGSVTAGNASGVNDGAAAVLMASAEMVSQLGLNPVAKVIATATVGVEPSIMGIGPAPAAKKALEIAGLSIEQMDVIELNEAFASQALAVLRELGLPDDAEHVNPNGGAIALGHPLGMSGTRLVIAACNELERRGGRYALCCMCIGVGQGIAMVIESV
ncbi:Beta-ketoadipyl CoA thiolase [Vibrio cincinnatiensis]|uniref:Beta-ketoadipyl-CoA thiolase n=1 Tax=Vibrio cincinnatiensis DSM 19608 TaxID=1123491 RepID=A0A1T4RVM5_VIBCI|nr:3-oxoadipyl-CoA thiolase [Vibrio cincinnatiensis]SKA20064.1 acetyl-CoA C-acetyltransferase [Vibrio cincinnatiensis DSM 19608]SUP49030.1 Beta-ketoadipyl CoA thiolase [Vibrio cincinnatiensis]